MKNEVAHYCYSVEMIDTEMEKSINKKVEKMKKRMMGFIAIVAIVAVAGYNVDTSQNNVKLSNLTLANVEALANGGEYDPSPNPGSKCKGGPYMCYMGQGNVWGKN